LVNTDKEGKPLFHGAGHYSIEVNGHKLNVVSQHLWYRDYAFDAGTADQAASAAQNGGDHYRLHEIEYIVNQTVNNPAYGAETMWLLCGDMNSRSRRDNWLYQYDEQSTHFLAHDFVEAQTNLVDVMNAKYGPNCVMATMGGLARLDFLYASPKLYERVERAAVLIDGWCSPNKNGNARDWPAPSDHRPLLIDLTLE
jgi:endonuclease/exonuclease/phosphatase family metal-dependent hydrolase